jgi:hypothetical protein
VAVGAAACGDSTAQPTDGGAVEENVLRRDGTVPEDGGPGADGSSGPDAMANEDVTSSDVTAEVSGSLDAGPVGTLVFANVGGLGSFLGIFFEQDTLAPWCSRSTVGPCQVVDCPMPDVSDAGPLVVIGSAGTLTITGPLLGDAGVAVTESSGDYAYNTGGAMFATGDTLGVSGTGGDVPAFGMHTVVAPGAITVVSPSLPPDGGAIVVPTSTDLSLAWTGGQAGAVVEVAITAEFANQGFSEMLCQWPASAGSGQIPEAALGTLISASPLQVGSVTWIEFDQTAFSSGDWAMLLSAETGGSVSATFE